MEQLMIGYPQKIRQPDLNRSTM